MTLWHKVPRLLLEAEALGDIPESACPLSVPSEVRQSLTLLSIPYFGFDGQTHEGQLVVCRDLAPEVRFIFAELLKLEFPIASMVPIVAYGWDDVRSMADNNTSAWNFRYIARSVPPRLSLHAYGRAIDINPRQNPCRSEGHWFPSGALYNGAMPGTIVPDSVVVTLFRNCGWVWGGGWTEPFDPQHFQKPFSTF